MPDDPRFDRTGRLQNRRERDRLIPGKAAPGEEPRGIHPRQAALRDGRRPGPVLRDMSREFDGLYARVGRPSLPPERLLRAQLLQLFYSIRSERLLMEQLDFNLVFRWFVDMDEPS